MLFMLFNNSCTCNGDHLNLLITTGNANRKGILSQTIINTFKKCKGRRKGIETQSEMMVAPNGCGFTITEINYLVVAYSTI